MLPPYNILWQWALPSMEGHVRDTSLLREEHVVVASAHNSVTVSSHGTPLLSIEWTSDPTSGDFTVTKCTGCEWSEELLRLVRHFVPEGVASHLKVPTCARPSSGAK